eukprot:comp16605_c0_seq1/m.14756 comp16605_c0_seq1/g.14756  ORF comp16605_c0_seq1/g.14756 comp16605_c0_seq1/m.14756 type:complete len:320 (-) comp16605_c0_seq1:418-1377(-)
MSGVLGLTRAAFPAAFAVSRQIAAPVVSRAVWQGLNSQKIQKRYSHEAAVPQELSAEARSHRLHIKDDDWTKIEGRVHSIESFSTIDGIGIRFMIFLQGCPLRCLFCSNPDTWEQNKGGQIISAGDMVAKLKKCVPYLKASKGGVTISGGEPLLQPEFVSTMFKQAKELGLGTAIDTTGLGSKKALDMVLPYTDMALWCVKEMTREKYLQMTQRDSFDKSQEFAAHLTKHNVAISLRYVLIPGITDDVEDLKRVVDFCHTKLPTLKWIELLPYHTLGVNKYEALGVKYPLENQRRNTREEIKKAVEILRDNGTIKVLCS